MRIYYDITLKDEFKNCSISYWADSFFVDENRILRVKSSECGDITVKIDANEKLFVREVHIEDEFDDIIFLEPEHIGVECVSDKIRF